MVDRMIPYEELVAALARWRAKQGLSSGPSARARRVAAPAAAPAPAFIAAPAELPEPPTPAPDLFGGSIMPRTEDHTVTNVAAWPLPEDEPARPVQENTSEIDIDSVDVVEERDL